MNSLYIDTLFIIFDYINTTKLKINHGMSINDILDIMWEVHKIQTRQQLYFIELKCKQIIMELKLKKKYNYIQDYVCAIIYEDNEYEYLYYA